MEDIERAQFKNKGHEFDYQFYKTPTLPILIQEIFHDNYHILDRGIELREGDVVVDIGANEGIFSIWLAKQFPGVKILAFEPVPRTFWQMVRNIGLNGIVNITAYNLGLGDKKGSVTMNVNKEFSGGSSSECTFDNKTQDQINAETIPLDNILNEYGIDHIRLLKMDVEGAEYHILYKSTILPKVDYFVGEFHINDQLAKKGYDINELATWVGMQTKLIYYDRCHMSE